MIWWSGNNTPGPCLKDGKCGIRISRNSHFRFDILSLAILIIIAFTLFLPVVFAEDENQYDSPVNLLDKIKVLSDSREHTADFRYFFSLGGSSGVRVENISPAFVDVEPHQIISVTFLVSNETRREREFTPTVLLPEGWQLITSQFPVTLKAGEEKFMYLAVSVPQDAAAGHYSVGLKVQATGLDSIVDAPLVDINVLSVAKINVVLLDSELRIIAGDKFVRKFVVTNNSNSSSRFGVDVMSNLSWAYDVEPMSFRLGTGESQTINITFESEDNILKEVEHRLTIEVQALDLANGAVRIKKRAKTIVYPGILKGEMYETLDGEYEILSTMFDDGEVGAQFRIELEGILGRGKWMRMEFNSHYPGDWSKFRFLQEDYFLLQYVDEGKIMLNLGDDQFHISELTDPYFYGRGVDLKAFKEPFSFRIFTTQRSAVRPSERMSGLQLSMKTAKQTEFTLSHVVRKELDLPSYLDRMKQSGSMTTLGVKTEPSEGVRIEGEYGLSSFDDNEGDGKKSDNAYYISADISKERFRFSGRLTKSGESFPGYWRNSKSGYASVNFKLTRDLNLWGTYRKSRKNLDSDPNSSDNMSTSYDVGIDFPVGDLGRASIYERRRNRRDSILEKWDEKDRTTNIRITRSFDNLTLTGSAEFGKRRDLLTGGVRNLEEFQLMLSSRIDDDSNVSGGFRWSTEDTQLGGEHIESNQFWLNTQMKLSEKWDLEARYNRSVGNNRRAIEWYRVDLEYQIGDGKTMQALVQYRTGYFASETEVALIFTFPVSIPMPWVPKCGRLEGYVFYDNGKREALEDVIVCMGTMKVATNKYGKYIFPALDEGSYSLDIERGSMDFGLIPDYDLSKKITITPGQSVRIDLPVVEASSVAGKVILTADNVAFEDNLVANGDFIDEYGGKLIKPMLVVLTNGIKKYERVVDLNGVFEFKNLRPDHYKLYIIEDQIPKYHGVNISEFEFDLEQGQMKRGMDFVLSPVERDMVITVKEKVAEG